MQITHTENQNETSVTCTRPDSTKIDFCHMENEVIIGETQGDDHHHIVLSLQEARELQKHLATVLG